MCFHECVHVYIYIYINRYIYIYVCIWPLNIDIALTTLTRMKMLNRIVSKLSITRSDNIYVLTIKA